MPRLLAALLLLLLAPLAVAQSVVGSWTYAFSPPGQDRVFETGFLSIPEEGGDGRIVQADWAVAP